MNKKIDVYYKKTFDLAKTLNIKSKDSADRLNDFLILQYGPSAVDLTVPTSWKYYKNISGEYHVTDTPMEVISYDTFEVIPFNKEILVDHPDTVESYQYGSSDYYNLVEKYPQQEQLILGILYPANINQAIAAEDGTILSYPSYLIEEQETTLIDELSIWLKRYMVRWNVRAFIMSDSLYSAACHSIMYLNLVPRILNLRTKRCKTNEAHSFHIEMYLGSHLHLDKYISYMTLKQKLFLYRNIIYLEKHAGLRDNFSWLVTKILSDRKIPIAEHSARYLEPDYNTYEAKYLFRKKPINVQFNTPDKDYFSLDELLTKEQPLAINNLLYSQTHYDIINQKFKYSASNVVQTKVLESSMYDYNDAIPTTLNEVIINHWAYLAADGSFTGNTFYNDPITREKKILTVLDGFIYFYYLSLRLIGINPETIPPFLAKKIQRKPLRTISQLMSIVNSKVVKAKVAEDILKLHPNILSYRTKSQFFNLCNKIYLATYNEWFLLANSHNLSPCGFVSGMISQIYADKLIHLKNNRLVTDWLAEVGLDPTNYSNDEISEIIISLYQNATSHVIDQTKLLKNIQKAMISMLSDLSSYSIQFIREINEDVIKLVNCPAARIDGIGNPVRQDQATLFNIRVINTNNMVKANIDCNVKPLFITTVERSRQEINLVTNFNVNSRNSTLALKTTPILTSSIFVEIIDN